MHKRNTTYFRGFTLVEIIVTVAVIAILASIAVVSYVVQQRETRDSQRDSRALVISEALEKYYDENGEYPSCSALSGTANEVSSGVLIGIDESVLTTPRDTSGSTNSISCSDLTDVSEGDYYAYVGDGSLNCVSGNACLAFTLKYVDEADGTIKTIESRNMTDIATSGTPAITVGATGFTTISASWTAIDNATAYTLQRATDSNFTQNLVEDEITGSSTTVTGLTMNTGYYFRVRATSVGTYSDWSATKNATTWNLAAPSLSSSSTITSITTSWSTVTHATAYTAQYSTNNSTWTTVCASTTATTCTRSSLTPGTTYYMRVRSEASGVQSSWATRTVATQPLGVPSPTRGTETTTTVAYSWSSVANATGYQYQYRINSGSWVGPTSTTGNSVTITSSNGARIDLQVRSTASGASSAWSSVSTGYLIPATPSVSYGSVTTSSITFSWGAITGASSYQYQTRSNSGSWSSVSSQTGTSKAVSSSTQGTKLDIQVRSVNGSGNASAWSSVSGTTLSVDGPAWNAWSHSYSYPNIVTWVRNSGGSSLCPSGTVVYARYAGGVGSVGSYGSYLANGSSSETDHWTESVGSYDDTLYSQIQGYCRNNTSGAQSSVKTTGVNTTKVPKPSVSLSGNSYCTSVYPSRTAFSVELRVNETSYNLDANTSVVSWWGYRKANNSGWKTYNETLSGNSYFIKIDGATVKSGTSASGRWRYTASVAGNTEALYNRSSGGTTTSFSGSRTITHNSNGTKSINVQISDTMSQVPFGSASCSKTYTLSDLR